MSELGLNLDEGEILSELQKEVGLNEAEGAEPHSSINSNLVQGHDDEKEFWSNDFPGVKGAQANVWDPQFLDFSKYIRKTYFSDIGIEDMQKMNRENLFAMIAAIICQISGYLLLKAFYADYWYIWGIPYFFVCCLLTQFGEIIHTRVHWPKAMCGNEHMDNLVDSVMMVVTGFSKESFRRRHIAAHYAEVANLARVFSMTWLDFITFPAVFYIYPHKLLKMYLDVEFCRRENLSRQQLLVEMVSLYTYLTVLVWELVFNGTSFILFYHMIPSLWNYGAQTLGAQISHSGIDRRNSFNSNGLFDWREAKGLFKVSLMVTDFFSNGGATNHGIHHAHTQLPLNVINKHYRELNAFCLKRYKGVRYNHLLSMEVHGDLYAKLPAPQWYDYIVQALFTVCLIFYSSVVVSGVPFPPPVAFERYVVDWRYSLYFNEADYWLRIVSMWEKFELTARKQLIVNPNAYLHMAAARHAYGRKYLETHKPTTPLPEDWGKNLVPAEVFEFNILKPLEELKTKQNKKSE